MGTRQRRDEVLHAPVVHRPAMNDERRIRRRIGWTVFVSLAGIVLLWAMYLARDVLVLVYLSMMLALGVSPLVRAIERIPLVARGRHVPRWLAILGLYLVILVLGAGMLAVVVPPFVQQSHALWRQLPGSLASAQNWLVAHGLLHSQLSVSELLAKAPNPDAAVSGLFGAVQQVVSGVLSAMTIVLLSFYMLVDAEDLHFGFVRFFPEDRRDQVSRIIRNSTSKVGAWLGGQLLLGLIIGGSTALGFYLIGVPYFYVLALICGLGELVPIVGPMLAAVPALLVAASTGVERMLVVGAYLAVQQFIENHFVVPNLMQKRVGVSPVTVLVALLIGGSLLGIVGAILAIPTAAIIQILVREYLEGRDA